MKHDFSWGKKGLIFSSQTQKEWIYSHGMLPTVEHVEKSIYKIYFGSRNKLNQSHIGYFTIDLDTLKIIDVSDNPILSPGKLGTFDDNGVLPSSVISIDDVKYMYHIGFKPGGTTRMDLFGGLCKFDENNQLARYSEAPIIERCKTNPYINTAPFVIRNHTGNGQKHFMYYVAGCGWIHKDLPKYNIQLACSNDGINWERDGTVCIDFKDANEVALARPYVLWKNNLYHMWFSYKGDAYSIGYATSTDGMNWDRQDELGGMKKSEEEGAFDSEMVAYPCVVPYKGRYFMFYNGNNYGFEGIGLAIADE